MARRRLRSGTATECCVTSATPSGTPFPACALDAILHIHRALDPPQLLDALIDATRAIGVAGSVYSVVIPEPDGEPFSFSLFACHPAFAHRQDEMGPIHEHPWLRFARTHSSPGTERGIKAHDAVDRAALQLASRYGFSASLIVPTSGGPNLERIEMLCLGRDRPGGFEEEDAHLVRTLARSLAGELHDWITHYLSGQLRQSANLQPADIQLLTLEWQGLGTKAISARTGMTPAAVDSRFQRLIARLECRSRKDAARKAAEHGLLDQSAATRCSARG